MKKSQLESMSVDELWALHEEVSQILSARIVEEKHQLEQRLEQLNQTHLTGTGVLELRARRSGSNGRRFYPKVYPKYQNPQVPEETWSGRGKQPKWLVKALAEGKKIEDFRIVEGERRLSRAEA
jgi:DNA-binding protein H-NS